MRLDVLLVERGLAPSRERAQALILEGAVRVGGEPHARAGQTVPADSPLEVVESQLPFVSRGGLKLRKALEVFEIDVLGKVCLDVGASTGGFTDCLLQAGAERVYAVDVGHGQLDWKLRQDARIVVLEKTNIRHLSHLPEQPDLATVDVSFISLAKVLPAVLACAADRYDCLALVKPQFEVGREAVGKGGVVRDAEPRRRVLVEIGEAARELGAAVLGFASSGLPGPKGNRETFVWLAEAGRQGAVADVEAAALEVEPG